MSISPLLFRSVLVLSVFFVLGFLVSSCSFDRQDDSGQTDTVQDDKNIEKIKEILNKQLKGNPKYTIQTSPVNGLYLVIAPPQVLYVSADAKYVINGDISSLQSGENFTKAFRNASRYAAVDAKKNSMIIFSPAKDKIKHTISVFTDMDCFYCQKLHKEISDFNRLGIEVRYLAYPRQGLDSPSYHKSVSVWCADDQKAALTKAKNGEQIPEKKCNDPVKEHFALGNQLGVRGTPAILLENGQLYPGYIPAARLSEALDQVKSKEARK